MALDVGERTIGIALSDESRMIASPLTTIRRTSLPEDLSVVAELVRARNVQEIVVGLPRSLDGTLHFQAERTLSFIEGLRGVVQVPIHLWDERFSTAEAERALISGQVRRERRKEVVDMVAAALILQGFLASQAFARDH
jgi:putative Holliday junction resolvase